MAIVQDEVYAHTSIEWRFRMTVRRRLSCIVVRSRAIRLVVAQMAGRPFALKEPLPAGFWPCWRMVPVWVCDQVVDAGGV